jgi:thiol-disulfide isomerase/thioredoxin
MPGVKFTELAGIAGYINAEPFKLADYVGKKVILVDFIDYTCINCQRTFPYLNDWYAKYKDQGLEVVAIHTPEFSFEKEKSNVEKGAQQFGLKFPIVLDNDYATWNAYHNQYWPHKYLIDIHGNVVYDHIGEGSYDETEQKIVQALNQRKMFLNESGVVTAGKTAPAPMIQTRSPETYFGAFRNENFGNGRPYTLGEAAFTLPATLETNAYYLGGTWKLEKEYAENQSADSRVSFVFNAAHMYIVAQTVDGSMISAKILIDGKQISADQSGADVKDGVLKIDASRLYNLYSSSSAESHRIDIIFSKPHVRIFTFTFG